MRITLPNWGLEVTADLLEDQAPLTCEAVWNELPIEATVTHAVNSGEELVVKFEGEHLIRFVEKENQTTNVIPGDMLWWYSWWNGKHYNALRTEVTEIAIVYGRDTTLRTPYGPAHGNLFAAITANLTELAGYGPRVCTDGAQTIRFDRL